MRTPTMSKLGFIAPRSLKRRTINRHQGFKESKKKKAKLGFYCPKSHNDLKLPVCQTELKLLLKKQAKEYTESSNYWSSDSDADIESTYCDSNCTPTPVSGH
jgi:hypothetical protein